MEKHFIRRDSITFSLSILTGFFVIIIFVWLISAGLWTVWSPTTNYYDQLATAFQHGQLSLQLKPDPALVALPNPYDPAERTGIPFLLDTSLYNGKYYLYFGPVPALVLLIIKPLLSSEIGDQHLVLLFISSTFVFQSLLIVLIYEHSFQDIPRWTVPLCIIVTGLMGPASWLLRTPYIHSVPMVSGQFFFMAGLYSVLVGIKKVTYNWSAFALAGVLWAGVIGSRINQILQVGFITVMVVAWILNKNYQRANKISKSISMIIALLIPLAVGLAALCLYNWARFNSIFETGIYYQLTGTYLQKNWNDVFSPAFVFQNLFNYMFIPPEIKTRFPFLNPVRGKMDPMFFSLPDIYYAQEITGLLFWAPFILFAIIPIVKLLQPKKDVENHQISQEDNNRRFIQWLTLGLLGCFLIGFVFYLAYFWVATRFVEDFFPPLALLSVLGFFQGYRHFSHNPISRNLYAIIGLSLAFISIVTSILLAIAINSSGFRESNPVLWRQLVAFFSP